MVFRGKPSKACARCRARRLRCDLHSGACGQCVRASVPCSGYRDTQQLRIRNESQSVMKKALKIPPAFNPRPLPLSVDLQARDAFFACYVAGPGRCWDCLKKYYHPTDSPDHLTVAIEAVSLAYLGHQVYSNAALVAARERYISALRMTNKSLKSSQETSKYTVLLAALLLDLFEKMTDNVPRNNQSWTSHVNGALALVSLRGLEQFRDPSELCVLARLSGISLISCVASGTPVPNELITIRAYVGMHLDVQDPRWRISELLIQYADLRNEIRRGILSDDECIRISMELDVKLQALDLDMPPSWQYSTTILDHNSERTFDLRFDSYPDGSVSHTRNFLRIVRILLNESLAEYYLASPMGDKLSLIESAHDNIKILVGEICACVPQYVDCDSAAWNRLPTSANPECLDQCMDHISDRKPKRAFHLHTPQHQLECYALIFPLYMAGRSKAVPDIGPWVIRQLHYMGSHFYVRNAELVAQILKQGTEANP